ncbi:MAG TPA: outer membrane beta-barrel protein [Rhizobiaceae bacterium]|nr:outer membrane beta-barrel protein [Rhizobiaceae bacterium]
MSGDRPVPQKRAETALFRAALLAAPLFCAGALPTMAQEAGLRGAVAEANVNDDLLSRVPLADRRTALEAPAQPQAAEQTGIPTPTYQPASEEPVAETPEDSLFADPEDDQDAQSTFGEPVEPVRPRRPSTAAERATAAGRDSEPETAAERNRAATAEPTRSEAEQDEDDTLTTGTVRAGTVDSEADIRVDPRAEPEAPIEGIDRIEEENPYEAIGIRAGSFILRPSIESGVTYTTNADYSPNGEDAFLSETTLRLNAVSDWALHSARLDSYGIFRRTISGAEVKETQAGANGELQLDLGHDYRATGTFEYERRPETAESPVEIVGVATRPLRQTLNGSLGLSKEFGKARFGVTGRVERDWYGDATLTNGDILSQEDRNSTLATVALRGGYEISPALTPFVEFEYGRRMMDVEVDPSGFERSATRLAARAGVELDMGEKFGGEISGGWLRETLDDSRLEPISGATVEADLRWSPFRGTTVALNGSTTVEGTTTAGESGSILYDGRLSIDRQLRANLTGTLAFGARYRDYVGIDAHDLTLIAEGSLTWWLNRYAGVTARARHETLKSSLPDRDSKTSSIFLGLKVQR